MIFKHLKVGWNNEDFEDAVKFCVETTEINTGLSYYDIKIDSKGNNCMVIFK